MRLQAGQRVLHFVLERKLGEGGFGEVWRAKAGLASTALKFVSVAGEDLERGRKEYSRVKLMIENGAFNHDRLIKLHGAWLLDAQGEDIPDGVLDSALAARTMELKDHVIEPDTLLIQMDLAQESLASLLKGIRKGTKEDAKTGVPVEDLLRYIRQAAEGIDFLNTPRTGFDGQMRGAVYHCDIKPENLLLADGKVRICDYGVARIEGQRKTRSPNALSLAHASPELIEDQPCAQSDQYSLAVTYAQLRTGRLPFDSTILQGSWRTVMRAVTAGELDLSGLEPRERAVIKRATSVNPKKRYRTATDMARELSRAVTGQTGIGEDEDESPRLVKRKRKLPWKSLLSLLVLGGLIAGGVVYGPQYLPKPDSNDDIEFQQAQLVFRQSIEKDPHGVDLNQFDRLAAFAARVGRKLAPEDLTALRDGTDHFFITETLRLDREQSEPLTSGEWGYVLKAREHVKKYLSKEQAESLLNRFALLEARNQLRVQWPDSKTAPASKLDLFSGEATALATGDVDLPGFVKNDAANLQTLRALAKWPGDASPINLGEAVNAVASVSALNASPGEKQRVAAFIGRIDAAARKHIAENGLDETVTNLGETWSALKIDPVSICLEAAVARDQAGDQAGAKKLFDSLAAYTSANGDASSAAVKRRIEWFTALSELNGANTAAALTKIEAALATAEPADATRLVDELEKRFARPLPPFDGNTAWAESELALLNAAMAIGEKLAATSASEDTAALLGRLVTQRAFVRLLLPNKDENKWADWAADVRAAGKAAAASPALLESLKAGKQDRLLGYCLAEVRTREPEASAAANVWAEGPLANANELARDRATDEALPGYVDYVNAIVGGNDNIGLRAVSIDQLAETYASADTAARLPALDWPERKAKAAEVLMVAALAMRPADNPDLSTPPLDETSAAALRQRLQLAESLGDGPLPGDVAPLMTLTAYYSAPGSPPEGLLDEVEQALAADPDRQSPETKALVLVSARLNQAAGKNDVAAARFAEALAAYDAWSKTESPDATRDGKVSATVLQEALKAADAAYASVSANASSPLRPALGQIYAGAAMLLARQAIATEDNKDRATLARYFERAGTLRPDPATIAAEAAWLKRFHTSRIDAELKRLQEVAAKLPANDPVAKTIRAYSLYLEYGLRPAVAQRRKDLLDAIKLYSEVIDGAPAEGTLDPKLYIERGDAYLQLAYVAHKARVELKETGPSIFEYLTQAQKNAEAVIDSSASSAMRVEAMNLWGNASEDMAYYAVDPDKDAWRSHYAQAIERFGQAFDEDSSSPIAPFNLARCRYRLSVDARRHAKPGEAIDSSSLEKAVNAVQAALTNWGASDSLKKAEAYYWLSEFQENLHKLDEADKARGEAVAMADRLGDPNWQVYQLQWAMLGMQRWMESTPANRDKLQTEARARVMKLLEVFGSGEAAATTAQTKRVDATNAAESIGLLIQLEVDPQRAIQTVEQALNGNRFAGNDPVNRACRAQIRLALASRILALRYSGAASFDTLKPQADAFAKEVLTLTNEPPLAEQEATNRAKAHWILGELDRAEVDPEKSKDQNVQFLTNAREHYRSGIEALPDNPELQFPELSARLNNVVGFAMTAAGQTRLSTKEQFRPIAAATEKYLLTVRPQVAALIPTQVINGKPASAWLTDIDRLSGIFKEAAKAQ